MEYFISTEKARLDLGAIHDFISISYWADGRTMEEVQATIENSLCFGIYMNSGKQVGFARVVTDHTFFGYLMDFFVLKEFQGKGFGKALMDFISSHETIKDLRTFVLKTKDAHEFYKRYGFQKIANSPLWMVNDKQILN